MLLYTDDSYRNGTCSYSIVKEINGTQLDIFCVNRLPEIVGIFLSEISAIKDAISYSVNEEKNHRAAKKALELARITNIPCFPQTIFNPFRSMQHHQANSTNRLIYNVNLNRSQYILLVRLRVGKTIFTTQRYYDRINPALCGFCSQVLSFAHVLSICQQSKINLPLGDILDYTTDRNL